MSEIFSENEAQKLRPGSSRSVPVFKDSKGTEVELPQARETLDAESQRGYKLWLSRLIERLNSTFHPRLPGKIENNLFNRNVINYDDDDYHNYRPYVQLI